MRHRSRPISKRTTKPWGQVTVDGDARMRIHRRSQEPFDVQTFALEDYAPAFDAAATPDLPLGYPVVEPRIANPLHANLGDADSGGLIALEGYDLRYDTPIRPGDVLALTLYWRALRPIDESYKVFNQSFYGDGVMVAQQDGFPVCGARGTWLWDPGELIVDRHLITVNEDAPDGLYPLYTGLYLPETLRSPGRAGRGGPRDRRHGAPDGHPCGRRVAAEGFKAFKVSRLHATRLHDSTLPLQAGTCRSWQT